MRIVSLFFILLGSLLSQEIDSSLSDKPENKSLGKKTFLVSCEHPIINKAKDEGLKSLDWKEFPFFLAIGMRCKHQAKQAGVEDPIEQLLREKQVERHDQSKIISGPGSCCITVTGLILLYSLLGITLGAGK